ncbi:hypothetical protein ACUXV3_16395 [Roseobacteraceae bacterium NS-SX3]
MILDNEPPHMLNVQIVKDTGGACRVASVEVLHDFVKHKLQFSGCKNFDQIFQQDISKYFSSLMQKVTKCPMVLSEPETVIDFGGLVLGRLRVLVSRANDAGASIAVRFQYFVGSIQKLFSFQSGFEAPTLAHREEIGARALESICTPLYSIAAFLDHLPQGSEAGAALRQRFETLRLESMELQFYSGLLRRYVDDCVRERKAIEEFECTRDQPLHGCGAGAALGQAAG